MNVQFLLLKTNYTKFHYTENNRLDSWEPRSSPESWSETIIYLGGVAVVSCQSHVNIYPTLQIWKTVKNGTRKCAIIFMYKNLIFFVLRLQVHSPTQNLQPTWWGKVNVKRYLSHVNISNIISSFYLLAGQKQKSREWFESINCQLYHVLHS